jgi:3-methyladenine DNA glycosylase AlkD
MHQLVTELIEGLELLADKHKAAEMAAYMKGKFAFYGVPAPDRKLVQKQVFIIHKMSSAEELMQCVNALYELPQRELHYMAVDLISKYKNKFLSASHLPWLQELVCTNSWWDTVYILNNHAVGVVLLKNLSEQKKWAEAWSNSDNMWLQRVAIIHQNFFKAKTNLPLLEKIILQHAHSKEFFIQKAIGWALRQYAYVDARWVRDFLNTHELAKLSVREASKHL